VTACNAVVSISNAAPTDDEAAGGVSVNYFCFLLACPDVAAVPREPAQWQLLFGVGQLQTRIGREAPFGFWDAQAAVTGDHVDCAERMCTTAPEVHLLVPGCSAAAGPPWYGYWCREVISQLGLPKYDESRVSLVMSDHTHGEWYFAGQRTRVYHAWDALHWTTLACDADLFFCAGAGNTAGTGFEQGSAVKVAIECIHGPSATTDVCSHTFTHPAAPPGIQQCWESAFSSGAGCAAAGHGMMESQLYDMVGEGYCRATYGNSATGIVPVHNV
jgi:hypothetical protein